MANNIHKIPNHCTAAKSMPLDIGVIHFVGIGGIGMSGIAEILHNLGYQVSGSDVSENANIDRLRMMGIKITIGQKAENVANASVVVKSTAVSMTNPEILAARENNIPVVKRSEMLAELTALKATIAVAGTHGKTTTTSLVGALLESAKLDPTVINGGIINAYGTNAYLGSGDWMVAEADESDGTFIKIPATVGVITNIDPEHLDFWGDFTSLKEGFATFINNLPFYGFAVLCNDHKEVKALGESIEDRRIVTYSIKEKNTDVRAVNIKNTVEGSSFDVEVSERLGGIDGGKIIKNVKLPIPGKHNILNALAAISVAIGLNIEDAIISKSFETFSGVKRRFTKVAEVGGVTIIDDYAHHPTEIKATLKAAKDVVGNSGRVIAVVQPHRYTRLEKLFVEFTKCFDDADKVVVTEVFAAGEQPILGADRDALVAAVNNNGGDAISLGSEGDLPKVIKEIMKSGDLVVCMGAGNISLWANELPAKLV